MKRLYRVIEWTGTPHASRRARVTRYQARNQGDAIRQHWARHEPGALLVTAERVYGMSEPDDSARSRGNECCIDHAQGAGGVGGFAGFDRVATTPPTSRARPAVNSTSPSPTLTSSTVSGITTPSPAHEREMLRAHDTPPTPAPISTPATARRDFK